MSQAFQPYLDPVIEMFTTGEYYKEVYSAKQEYFEKAGVVYEDDAEFENRMCIFMDWYLFDRALPGIDLPPIRLYLRKIRGTTTPTPEVLAIYEDFCRTIHSIFYLSKAKDDITVVKDLFSKKTYEVQRGDLSTGFLKGDIFEARLIPFQGKYEFSRGFCFHPVEMEKFILGEIKKVRYQDAARQMKLILQLASMKLKHARYQHINIKHIYTFEPKF